MSDSDSACPHCKYVMTAEEFIREAKLKDRAFQSSAAIGWVIWPAAMVLAFLIAKCSSG